MGGKKKKTLIRREKRLRNGKKRKLGAQGGHFAKRWARNGNVFPRGKGRGWERASLHNEHRGGAKWEIPDHGTVKERRVYREKGKE